MNKEKAMDILNIKILDYQTKIKNTLAKESFSQDDLSFLYTCLDFNHLSQSSINRMWEVASEEEKKELVLAYGFSFINDKNLSKKYNIKKFYHLWDYLFYLIPIAMMIALFGLSVGSVLLFCHIFDPIPLVHNNLVLIPILCIICLIQIKSSKKILSFLRKQLRDSIEIIYL